MITNSVEEAILLSDRIVPMLAGPPARLGTPIPVALSRPRSIEQLAHEEQATQVRGHIIATLTAAPGRRAAARDGGTPVGRGLAGGAHGAVGPVTRIQTMTFIGLPEGGREPRP